MISAISASFFGQLISAIQPLLLVPLFLRAWGGEGYGEWCILFAIVSYFSLLDFGSQNYIGNVLTENLIQKHKHNFQSNLSNAVSLFIIISGICFAFFIAIIYITTTFFSDLLPIKNQIENEQWILIFLGGSMLLSIPAGIYSTVYRAFNMVARVTIISNILRFFQLFIMAGALYMEYSPLAYAALYFLFSIIGVVVNIVDLRATFGDCVYLKFSLQNAKNGLKFFRGASYFWFLSLIGNINQQAPVIFMGLFASPLGVSLYVTHKAISNSLNYVGAIFHAPLWPEFTKLLTNGEKKKVFRLTLFCIRTVFYLTGIMALFIWFIVPNFYSFWTANKLTLDTQLLFILLFQGVLMSFWGTSSWSFMAGSRQYRLIQLGILNIIVTFVLSMLLSKEYGGILGWVLASLICDVVIVFYFIPAIFSKAMGCNVIDLFKQLIKTLLPLFFYFLFLYCIHLNYWSMSQVFNIILMLLISMIFVFYYIIKKILPMIKYFK